MLKIIFLISGNYRSLRTSLTHKAKNVKAKVHAEWWRYMCSATQAACSKQSMANTTQQKRVTVFPIDTMVRKWLQKLHKYLFQTDVGNIHCAQGILHMFINAQDTIFSRGASMHCATWAASVKASCKASCEKSPMQTDQSDKKEAWQCWARGWQLFGMCLVMPATLSSKQVPHFQRPRMASPKVMRAACWKQCPHPVVWLAQGNPNQSYVPTAHLASMWGGAPTWSRE